MRRDRNNYLFNRQSLYGLIEAQKQALAEGIGAPALFVVGEVVRYREKLLALSVHALSSSQGQP